MSDQVESNVAALPEPAPPAAFARTVMARVSRLADDRSRRAGASSSVEKISREGRRTWNDTVLWIAAAGGLVIVFAAWVAGGLEPGSWSSIVWSVIASPPSVRAPADGTALTAFALGLLLYVAGLFAPLRRRQ